MQRATEFSNWLVGALRCGVIAVDESGCVSVMNAEARSILGEHSQALGDSLGLPVREVLMEHPAVARLLEEGLEGREPPSRAELSLAGRAGAPERTIGFTLAPVRDESQAVRGAALLFRDLTPFERMDEQARLTARLAALGEVTAGLAHEIRNPLASMAVMAGLLKRRLDDRPEERALLDDLAEELRAVDRVVTTSLDFVRPSAPERDRAQPLALIEACLARAQSRVSFSGRIEREYASNLPELEVDGDQLQCVFTDLFVNALEAMEGGGVESALRVGVHRLVAEPSVAPAPFGTPAAGAPLCRLLPVEPTMPRQEILFSIGDTGPGVPETLRERIFYPFFTTKQQGSGVGLAMAQKIVASHDGTLELLNSPRRGALFHVRLPLESALTSSCERARAWPRKEARV